MDNNVKRISVGQEILEITTFDDAVGHALI
jgi:hypothetical protein